MTKAGHSYKSLQFSVIDNNTIYLKNVIPFRGMAQTASFPDCRYEPGLPHRLLLLCMRKGFRVIPNGAWIMSTCCPAWPSIHAAAGVQGGNSGVNNFSSVLWISAWPRNSGLESGPWSFLLIMNGLNYTQFKRILSELTAVTTTPDILESTVAHALSRNTPPLPLLPHSSIQNPGGNPTWTVRWTKLTRYYSRCFGGNHGNQSAAAKDWGLADYFMAF